MVGPGQQFGRINQAYEQWKQDNVTGGQPDAVIEITDSGAYQEQIEFAGGPGDRLEVRAADGAARCCGYSTGTATGRTRCRSGAPSRAAPMWAPQTAARVASHPHRPGGWSSTGC